MPLEVKDEFTQKDWFMKLYLIQHAQAKSKNEDPERGLTEEGMECINKTASFLKKAGQDIKNIWHSGKKRALQSADIIAGKLDGCSIVQKDGLAPNDNPDLIIRQLSEFDKNIVIVGHLPFLSKLTSKLLDSSREVAAFKNAGIVCLHFDTAWTIEWMIIPELM